MREDRPLFAVPLLSVERLLYQGELVCIGRFDCPTGHALFEDSGPTTTYCIVFPRSTVWIAHEGERPFVADRTTVTLYNRDDRYRRTAIDPRGDHADWIAFAPEVLQEIVSQANPGASPERIFGSHRAPCSGDAYLAERALVQHVVRETAGGVSPDRLLVEETAVRLANALAREPRNGPAKAGRRTADLWRRRGRPSPDATGAGCHCARLPGVSTSRRFASATRSATWPAGRSASTSITSGFMPRSTCSPPARAGSWTSPSRSATAATATSPRAFGALSARRRPKFGAASRRRGGATFRNGWLGEAAPPRRQLSTSLARSRKWHPPCPVISSRAWVEGITTGHSGRHHAVFRGKRRERAGTPSLASPP